MEMFGYFAQLVMELREQPGDDLISQLLTGRIDGEPVPWEQVVAEAGLLLAGGLDTTRAAASAAPCAAHRKPGSMACAAR